MRINFSFRPGLEFDNWPDIVDLSDQAGGGWAGEWRYVVPAQRVIMDLDLDSGLKISKQTNIKS